MESQAQLHASWSFRGYYPSILHRSCMVKGDHPKVNGGKVIQVYVHVEAGTIC